MADIPDVFMNGLDGLLYVRREFVNRLGYDIVRIPKPFEPSFMEDLPVKPTLTRYWHLRRVKMENGEDYYRLVTEPFDQAEQYKFIEYMEKRY